MKVVCTVTLAAISLALVTAAVPSGSPSSKGSIDRAPLDYKGYENRDGDEELHAQLDDTFDPEVASYEESNGYSVPSENSNAPTELPIARLLAHHRRRRNSRMSDRSAAAPEENRTVGMSFTIDGGSSGAQGVIRRDNDQESRWAPSDSSVTKHRVAKKPEYLKMAADHWLETLQNASKTAVIQDGKRKVHFLLEDGREMVEEYSMDTNVLVRRAWREKGNLGQDTGWNVEIGDPEPRRDTIEVYGIQESSSTPFITRRVTKTSLEWRIRNLPYPEDVYSVNAEGSTIIVRTSNKKYFKRLEVPDLERIGLKPEEERISFNHRHNTLIITYKKPPQLLELEKKVMERILEETSKQDRNVECPTS